MFLGKSKLKRGRRKKKKGYGEDLGIRGIFLRALQGGKKHQQRGAPGMIFCKEQLKGRDERNKKLCIVGRKKFKVARKSTTIKYRDEGRSQTLFYLFKLSIGAKKEEPERREEE